MKKFFSKKETAKVKVEAFKELNDEQLNKIIGGDSRIRMRFDFLKLFGK
ncbi:COMC family protein [Streptococcus constellatus]|uniref:COMC family protein n=1 Tax=Streptococcus constellatus TaxID=76860 RepID=A0A564T900_STRCV|nr:ComC/BlpC family leader-containing pheromone/bacteriocin [Streptococcus constellatus]VUX03081.1 COMC family protein [Streptococcus gordonii]VUX03564.1 COMC family protein [Streptococcus constellatus]